MNKDILSGKWMQLKGEMRKTWGSLTDDDLDRAQGSGEKLAGILRERYGWSKEEAERRIAEFAERAEHRVDEHVGAGR